MLIAKRALDWIFIPLVIIALAYEPNFAHGFINYNETGQHLAAIGALQRGELLFRDIFVQYGALHFYIPYWAFEYFGNSLALLRGYFIMGEIAGLLAAYALCRQVIRNRPFAYLAGVVIVIEAHHPFWSTRWGGWRFAFVYLAALALIRFWRSGKPGWMIVAGASSGIAFLHTYEAGVAAGAGAAAYFGFEFAARRGLGEFWRGLLCYNIGAMALLLPFFGFLVFTGTLGEFLAQLPFANPGRAWIQPVLDGDLTPTVLAPGVILILSSFMVLRDVAKGRWRDGRTYSIAILICAGGVLYLVAFRAIRGPQFEMSLPIPVILAAYWMAEAFACFEASLERPEDRVRGWAAFACVWLGMLAFAMGEIRTYAGGPIAWARYQLEKGALVPRHIGADPLNDDFRVIDVAGCGSSRVPGWQADEIEGVTALLRRELKPDEPLFPYPDLGIFNYFADRPHITRFQIPILAAVDEGWSEEVMQALRGEGASIVLLGTQLSTLARATRNRGEYLPDVREFVLAHYRHQGRVGRIDVFRLREEP